MTPTGAQEDIATFLVDDDPVDGSTLSERGFLMAAEGTRHVWDTPEEDEAWAHLSGDMPEVLPA